MNAEVGQEIDRPAVARPHRPVDVVRFAIADEDACRAAGRRHQKQFTVVVGVELRVRSGNEQDLRIVRGDRGAAFRDGVGGQASRVRSIDVGDPDLAFVRRAQQRRRGAMEGDLPAVFREVVRGDGEIAGDNPGFLFRRHRDRPELRLLVGLVVEIHVVLDLVARFFVSGLRLGRDEEQGRPIRCPRQLRDAARVRRELTRLAAVGRQQINLREFVVAAFGDERDRPAVRATSADRSRHPSHWSAGPPRRRQPRRARCARRGVRFSSQSRPA